jgi:hypothetical protein
MPGFAAFLLATPLFGLQLQAPMISPGTLQPGAWFAPSAALDIDATLPLPTLLQAADAQTDSDARTAEDEDAAYAAAVRQRQELGQIHRTMGIVTWASMSVTVALGLVQYYNLYGFGAGINDNPCATGNAVFGQSQCWGTPYPHLVSAVVTTVLYSTTLAMSIGLLLNDPNQVLTGRGEYSDRIRIHSVLAIVHLVGMVAQTVIGIGIANNWFGDRANNYDSLQTVAAVHQAIGWTTWGALGAAGALMLF